MQLSLVAGEEVEIEDEVDGWYYVSFRKMPSSSAIFILVLCRVLYQYMSGANGRTLLFVLR